MMKIISHCKAKNTSFNPETDTKKFLQEIQLQELIRILDIELEEGVPTEDERYELHYFSGILLTRSLDIEAMIYFIEGIHAGIHMK